MSINLDPASLDTLGRIVAAHRPGLPSVTYAIGDIHGEFDQLIRLLDRLWSSRRHEGAFRFVFLGDLIDRGPQSASCIEAVRMLQKALGAEAVVALQGNHEAMMVAAHSNEKASATWLENGGQATLQSYCPHVPKGPSRENFIPADVVHWIAGLPTLAQDSHRYFVHAGLRPGVPLADQNTHDLLWIREPFLRSNVDFGKLVVHGHTPVRSPEVTNFRINLDTGAGLGGRLTAGIFAATNARC